METNNPLSDSILSKVVGGGLEGYGVKYGKDGESEWSTELPTNVGEYGSSSIIRKIEPGGEYPSPTIPEP